LISVIMFFVFTGLEIWLGARGNEMTAKNYLEQGWRLAEPQSETTRFARGKWGIQIEEAIPHVAT
jgi:hypothetical protein